MNEEFPTPDTCRSKPHKHRQTSKKKAQAWGEDDGKVFVSIGRAAKHCAVCVRSFSPGLYIANSICQQHPIAIKLKFRYRLIKEGSGTTRLEAYGRDRNRVVLASMSQKALHRCRSFHTQAQIVSRFSKDLTIATSSLTCKFADLSPEL